jgi:hypothetical protein
VFTPVISNVNNVAARLYNHTQHPPTTNLSE